MLKPGKRGSAQVEAAVLVVSLARLRYLGNLEEEKDHQSLSDSMQRTLAKLVAGASLDLRSASASHVELLEYSSSSHLGPSDRASLHYFLFGKTPVLRFECRHQNSSGSSYGSLPQKQRQFPAGNC
mmetsp:Transcript_7362/g.12830  ORF Transcript_7362/g.12830 Transcript_7362/m.12830 type:complete len:126 (+) Transcript_7362:21-398(+)